MRTINVSKFKKHFNSLLNNLGSDGIMITKHDKPVARVIPVRSDCSDLIGCMKGQIKIHGNILSTATRSNAGS